MPQSDEKTVTPGLQAALCVLCISGFTALGAKVGMDPKEPTIAVALAIAGTAAGAALFGAYLWFMLHIQTQKVVTAETRSPGITDPKSVKPTEELTVTTSVNDVTNNLPPTVTSTVTKPTNPNPEV